MGRKKRSLNQDPRYLGYAAYYRNHPELFLKEELGIDASWQQNEIAQALKPDGAKVSVSSGHGTGKGYWASGYAIYFLVCHPESLVMLTANNIDQVQKVIFKYIRKHWRNYERKRQWVTDYFDLTATMLREKTYKEEWAIFAKTASKGHEEALAGIHAENLLVMVDEASGVNDKAFDTLWGIFTQKNNKMLLMSQYTKPSGHFAESQTSLSKTEGNPSGLYERIVLNSEESPFVTIGAIRGYVRRFGGKNSPEYGIRVLGICPDSVEGFLITRSSTAKGFHNKITHDPDYGYVGSVDVATDGLRDKSEVTITKVSGSGDLRRVEDIARWTAPTGVDGIQLAKELMHMESPYPNITWAIDADGYGKATCQEAERLGLNVYRVHWGRPMHSKSKRDQYFNQRSYAAVMVRDALRDGRMKLISNSGKDETELLNQFSKIAYGFTDGIARWKLWSKAKMKAIGISSPDIFDTHCFPWLVEYISADEEEVEVVDEVDPWEEILGNAINI